MLTPVAIDPEGIASDYQLTDWIDRAVECV